MDEIVHLPPEVYENILNRITEPTDVINCSNCCPEWKELIGHEKLTAAYLRLVLKDLLPYLNPSDMKNLSMVSTRWMKAVDDLSISEYGSENWNRLQPPIELDEVAGIRRFLAKCANHGIVVNYLNFRHVVISESGFVGTDVDYYEEFISLVSEFLEKFGYMVQTLDLTSYSGTMFNLVKFLHLCVSKTPSLSYLILQLQSSSIGCSGIHGEDLQTFLSENPFPNSTLSFLTVNESFDTPNLISRLLYQKYGNQLRVVSHLNISVAFRMQPFGLTFRNLICVRLYLNDEIADLVRLVSLLCNLQCRLDCIEIKFKGMYSIDSASYDVVKSIFIALKDFQSQISTASLELEECPWGESVFPLELLTFFEMKNVTKFVLDNIEIPELDFFKLMPKIVDLTILKVRNNFDTFVNATNITEMWKVMQKLRCVTIETFKDESDSVDPVKYESTLDMHLFKLQHGGY